MSRSAKRGNEGQIIGVVRCGGGPLALARRMDRGQIAIVDAIDLDARAAAELADAGVRAVVNLSPSVSGRVAVRGAEVLAARGVALFDACDRELLGAPDGQLGQIEALALGESREPLAEEASFTEAEPDEGERLSTHVMTVGDVRSQLRAVTASADPDPATLAVSAAALGAAVAAAIAEELPTLTEGDLTPGWVAQLHGREVLVVDVGLGWREQWRRMRPAVKERRMVVVATGLAAEVVTANVKVAAIIGPIDGLADSTLRRADAVISQADAEAEARRIAPLGIAHVTSSSWLAAADLAVAAAAARGAERIIVIGHDATLADVVASQAGVSQLTARMAAGAAWIDASGFLALYRSRWSRLQAWLWIVLAAGALAGALALQPQVRELIDRWTGA